MRGVMDVSQAGFGNGDTGSEARKTENTPMASISPKTRGVADSRVRKTSKYLSYPYTSSGPKLKSFPAETEESKTPSLAPKAKASSKTSNPTNESLSLTKSDGERFQNNWYRKFISCTKMCSSPKFIDASSSDLLSGLHSLAVGSMSPSEDKSFDMVEWFFCKYRISKYHDETELATSLFNLNEGKTSKPVDNSVADAKSEKKRKNTQTENAARRKMKSLSALSDTNTNVSIGDHTNSGKELEQKKKVEKMTSLHQLQNEEITVNEEDKEEQVPEVMNPPAAMAPPLEDFMTPTQPTRPTSMSGDTPPILQLFDQILHKMSLVREKLRE